MLDKSLFVIKLTELYDKIYEELYGKNPTKDEIREIKNSSPQYVEIEAYCLDILNGIRKKKSISQKTLIKYHDTLSKKVHYNNSSDSPLIRCFIEFKDTIQRYLTPEV